MDDYVPSKIVSQRVRDLCIAGTPKYLIAKVIKISEETLNKYYGHELATAKAEAIERIAKTVYVQAYEGDSKAQALYLKTQGASQGWVEKQIIEQVDAKETNELIDRIAVLEQQHKKEF